MFMFSNNHSSFKNNLSIDLDSYFSMLKIPRQEEVMEAISDLIVSIKLYERIYRSVLRVNILMIWVNQH